MAKKKGGRPESSEGINMRENARFEDTVSASRTLVDAESFERGYPATMNSDLHINEGRRVTGKYRGGAD